jgi:hypothetical protein
MQKYIKTARDSVIIEFRMLDLNYKKCFFCDRRSLDSKMNPRLKRLKRA